jgi:phage tail sheath gpL-like
MGVWKVSDGEDPRAGKAVVTIANTDTGMIAIAVSGDSAGIAFVPVETAERIRVHLSAAINAARGRTS